MLVSPFSLRERWPRLSPDQRRSTCSFPDTKGGIPGNKWTGPFCPFRMKDCQKMFKQTEIAAANPICRRYCADVITLLIATRNVHKVGEIRAILGGSFQFRTLNDFPDAPKTVEDADTFAGNAAKKAVELAKWLHHQFPSSQTPDARPDFVLADDSGLEVDALDGAPGVHSARFAALDSANPATHPTPTTTPSCCVCSRTFRRRNARRGSIACWRLPNPETRNPRRQTRSCSTAFAKGGFFLSRAETMASATIRCLCRWGLSRHLPNWAKI